MSLFADARPLLTVNALLLTLPIYGDVDGGGSSAVGDAVGGRVFLLALMYLLWYFLGIFCNNYRNPQMIKSYGLYSRAVIREPITKPTVGVG